MIDAVAADLLRSSPRRTCFFSEGEKQIKTFRRTLPRKKEADGLPSCHDVIHTKSWGTENFVAGKSRSATTVRDKIEVQSPSVFFFFPQVGRSVAGRDLPTCTPLRIGAESNGGRGDLASACLSFLRTPPAAEGSGLAT